jgi:hypothetical protein
MKLKDASDVGPPPMDELGLTYLGDAATWPAHRRAVWGQTRRFSVPDAAERFDGFKPESLPLLWRCWQHVKFPAGAMKRMLREERRAIDAFEAADPTGAAAIADILTLYRADLDTIEREAAKVGDGRPAWERRCPEVANTVQTYLPEPRS